MTVRDFGGKFTMNPSAKPSQPQRGCGPSVPARAPDLGHNAVGVVSLFNFAVWRRYLVEVVPLLFRKNSKPIEASEFRPRWLAIGMLYHATSDIAIGSKARDCEARATPSTLGHRPPNIPNLNAVGVVSISERAPKVARSYFRSFSMRSINSARGTSRSRSVPFLSTRAKQGLPRLIWPGTMPATARNSADRLVLAQ